MKPFRKKVALAVDGGGIRGLIVARALMMLETELRKPLREVFQLTAGTSTGAIIAAAVAAGIQTEDLYHLYQTLGPRVFAFTLRKAFFRSVVIVILQHHCSTFLKPISEND